jgi:YD repeat-containing protein
MKCTYDADGKLTAISLDDRNISITYDGDELKRISYISVDLKNAPTNS